MKSDHYYKR
jgi:hypothetical protein